MITVEAPAKINLTMEVLGKRADGFHEVRSVIQTVSLCDRLSFEKGEQLDFRSSSPGWDAEKSLVSEATRMMQEVPGSALGAVITVDKQIPLISGFGGDSSDAAATLLGLNRLWELELSKDKLFEMANRLGSDVAFFLNGGIALVEGRGEIVKPLPPLPECWFILAVPDFPRTPGKTKLLYESLKPVDYTGGEFTRKLVEGLEGRSSGGHLFNVFEKVASDVFPGLRFFRDRLRAWGASNVHLAGSGPGLFILEPERKRAEGLYRRLEEQKIEVYLAETFTPGPNL